MCVCNSSIEEVETGTCWLESTCIMCAQRKHPQEVGSLLPSTTTSTLSLIEVTNRQMTPNKQRHGWQGFLGLKNFIGLH